MTFDGPGSVGLLLEYSDGSDHIRITSVAAQGPAKQQKVKTGARVASINDCDITAMDFDAALELCALRPLTLGLIESE